MFASLKEKFLSSGWVPQDENDKAVAELLDRATSDSLPSPDWDTNMKLVDMVNNHPSIMEEKLLRGLRRCLIKGSAKSQLLTLTVLETCIKNCHPSLYALLSASELWSDMVKSATDTSVHRVDGEVRDKILCLVEDYASVLPQAVFKETYEGMVVSGVDFPVRSAGDAAPILTPPPSYHTHADSAFGAGGGGGGGAEPVMDPFAGMTAEDKAAVQAAMIEMSHEAPPAAPSPAGGLPVSTIPAATSPDSTVTGVPLTQSQAALYTAPVATVARAQSDAAQDALEGESTETVLQVMANSTGLLQEMLTSIEADSNPQAVREPYIMELGDQCVRLQSKLEVMIGSLTNEKEMMDALAQHEHMTSVLAKYDEAVARAECGATGGVAPASGGGATPPVAAPVAVAGGVGAGAVENQGTGAGAIFTLIDDDEALDEAPLLVSKRQPANAATPALQGSTPAASNTTALHPGNVTPPPQDLLDVAGIGAMAESPPVPSAPTTTSLPPTPTSPSATSALPTTAAPPATSAPLATSAPPATLAVIDLLGDEAPPAPPPADSSSGEPKADPPATTPTN